MFYDLYCYFITDVYNYKWHFVVILNSTRPKMITPCSPILLTINTALSDDTIVLHINVRQRLIKAFVGYYSNQTLPIIADQLSACPHWYFCPFILSDELQLSQVGVSPCHHPDL